MLRLLQLLSRMLLIQVALQQARQLLVGHRRRHRPPQRRLRMTIDGAVWAVVEVVEVPEALPQGAEAADGGQGGGRGGRRGRRGRQPGGGRQPALWVVELIARDPRGRGRRQGLVDVEGPEKE